jgi:hypothetical protein
MAWLNIDKFTESRSLKKWVENLYYQGRRVFDRRCPFISSMTTGDDPTGMLGTAPYGTVAVNTKDEKVWIHDAVAKEWVLIASPPAPPKKKSKK